MRNSIWHDHRSLLFWREIIYNCATFLTLIIYSMDAFIEIDVLCFSRCVTSRNPLYSNAASVAACSRAREEAAINRQAGGTTLSTQVLVSKSQGRPATVFGDLNHVIALMHFKLTSSILWRRGEGGQKHTKQTINYDSIIGQGFNEAGGCSLVHLCQLESLTWVAQSKRVLISISSHMQRRPRAQPAH